MSNHNKLTNLIKISAVRKPNPTSYPKIKAITKKETEEVVQTAEKVLKKEKIVSNKSSKC